MKTTSGFLLLIIAILMSSCIADMRTRQLKREGLTPTNELKGKMLLEVTWQKHGFESLKGFSTYSFEGKDTWKGLFGKLGKVWPENQSTISFKYVIGTFDGQVRFEDGKEEGSAAGLQSWHYYEIDPDGALNFKETDKRIAFGISAYQYLIELLDRLRQAPVIAYAGEKIFRDTEYQIVFATWEKPEPHREHDQYQLWINKETGLLDFAVYSVRDNFLKLPGSGWFYGSIQFDDYREIDGVLIPHEQTVYLNKPKKNPKRHLHRLQISDFRFDDFELEELYPDPEIKPVGDRKKIEAKGAGR